MVYLQVEFKRFKFKFFWIKCIDMLFYRMFFFRMCYVLMKTYSAVFKIVMIKKIKLKFIFFYFERFQIYCFYRSRVLFGFFCQFVFYRVWRWMLLGRSVFYSFVFLIWGCSFYLFLFFLLIFLVRFGFLLKCFVLRNYGQ